jgi:hypothetical protein
MFRILAATEIQFMSQKWGFLFSPFSTFSCPLFGGSFVFYKIRRFLGGGGGFKYFAQYIYQTGLKNQCIRDDAGI